MCIRDRPYVFCQMKKQIGVEDVAKFLFSSGNIDAGTIKLYGIKDS